MYYIYMLRCRDGSFYTGIAADIEKRLRQHASGGAACAKYTRAHPPEAVAALWRCGDKSAAARLEYAIKAKLTHGEKLALIAEPGRVAAWFPELAGVYTGGGAAIGIKKEPPEAAVRRGRIYGADRVVRPYGCLTAPAL